MEEINDYINKKGKGNIRESLRIALECLENEQNKNTELTLENDIFTRKVTENENQINFLNKKLKEAKDVISRYASEYYVPSQCATDWLRKYRDK